MEETASAGTASAETVDGGNENADANEEREAVVFTAADAITAEAHDRCKATRFQSSVDDVAAVVLFMCEPPATEAGGGAGEASRPLPTSTSSSSLLFPPLPPSLTPGFSCCDAANSPEARAAMDCNALTPPRRLFEEHVALGRAVAGVVNRSFGSLIVVGGGSGASNTPPGAPGSSTHGSDAASSSAGLAGSGSRHGVGGGGSSMRAGALMRMLTGGSGVSGVS